MNLKELKNKLKKSRGLEKLKARKGMVLGAAALSVFSMSLSNSSHVPSEPETTVQSEFEAANEAVRLAWQRERESWGVMPYHQRPLTLGEQQMLHRMLGPDVNLNEMQVLAYPYMPAYIYAAEQWRENRNTLMIGVDSYSQDYSKEKDVDKYGAFIEQIVLLRQTREGMSWPEQANVMDETLYDYDLDINRRLSGYERFQQAAMIADYAQRFLHPTHNGVGSCAADDVLALTVEREFNSAAVYRDMLPEDRPMQLLDVSEMNLARAIFGSEIDTSVIQKRFSPRQCRDADAVTYGNQIYFYGDNYYRDNYASASDLNIWGLFVHELTHIWHYQQGHLSEDSSRHEGARRYDYTLEEGKSFHDFQVEQQAEIIRDYAHIYLRADGNTYAYAQNYDLLRKTVESRFPAAAFSRQSVAENGEIPAYHALEQAHFVQPFSR